VRANSTRCLRAGGAALEDAYIELLGGARKGESLLARAGPRGARGHAAGSGSAAAAADGVLVRAAGLTRRFGDFVPR